MLESLMGRNDQPQLPSMALLWVQNLTMVLEKLVYQPTESSNHSRFVFALPSSYFNTILHKTRKCLSTTITIGEVITQTRLNSKLRCTLTTDICCDESVSLLDSFIPGDTPNSLCIYSQNSNHHSISPVTHHWPDFVYNRERVYWNTMHWMLILYFDHQPILYSFLNY